MSKESFTSNQRYGKSLEKDIKGIKIGVPKEYFSLSGDGELEGLDREVKEAVEEAIAQTEATSIQDVGKVMGVLMPKVKGKADGRLVSKIVKESLI